MKAVMQRVSHASVQVDGKTVGEIGTGVLILLGVCQGDTEADIDKLMKKVPHLRIFTDEHDKMNLSLLDIEGEILVVSQFTLCADCSHGRRPSFTESACPEEAKRLYEAFICSLQAQGIAKVEHGVFGAHMEVRLTNHGPVTILLDSKELK